MSKFRVGIIFLWLLQASLLPGQPHPLEITHLTGDLYVYTTYRDFNGQPYPSNSMYLATAEGVVLIDTPWDTAQCQPLLDSIEARHHHKVILCIATHSHDDRTAGLEFFNKKGIKTFSSKQTYDLCKEKNEKQAEFFFTRDTTFQLGGYSLQTFYPGGGHTGDNIVLYFAHDRVLYGGCFVKSTEAKNLGNIADANLKDWPESIKKTIRRFPRPAFVIPGHLGWERKGGLRHTLKLLRKQRD